MTMIGGAPAAWISPGTRPVWIGHFEQLDSPKAKIAPNVGDAFSNCGIRAGTLALGIESSWSRQFTA
jgi:hypothetical protein